ncbi:HAD superfamily hydrolase (TIGR01509 family)/HAD superfamily hydrolase (TIGR01549 family) [Cricetibacter osteomyelitidis]|uniref:HAD superfamily hydrolase (TIGR01509 family)/HAD superfamily hydrolase (TIGR01549 family) n=1 Tax=Cricetibacter osteomyelitidis TaxID=1521931 RepID=A0A4R2T9W4_9PAST|nr:HAD family phosphatase [Cricetibacter osteomyelitidis]TCP97654.1 HAD superfamily hydrolase (TIGR01509 family)/HAD superfamily hydrolase (TIGR01549 family) [Cricetibacter osteomyelitidis]
MLQAIIFDMDGVIVDTEYVEFALQKDFIRGIQEHNNPITHKEYSEVAGKSLKDIPEIIKRLSGSSLPLDEIRARYQVFFHNIFDNIDYQTIFRKDIKQIIQYAKANNIKIAVASSSAFEHIRNILTACGIFDEFDYIVSGEQFAQSKPHPEIYLHTLETLGVSAENAVAVEDSYYGIIAAKKANINVIAYEETRMDIDQSLADYKGKDMLEILAIIKTL